MHYTNTSCKLWESYHCDKEILTVSLAADAEANKSRCDFQPPITTNQHLPAKPEKQKHYQTARPHESALKCLQFSKVPPIFKTHHLKGVFLIFKLDSLTLETTMRWIGMFTTDVATAASWPECPLKTYRSITNLPFYRSFHKVYNI